MTYQFSEKSKDEFVSCHPKLMDVLSEAIKYTDFTILEGYRDPKRQDQLFRKGLSKAKAGESKHNSFPSMAVDLAPYPIDWKDTERFALLAGHILAISKRMGYNIRWGKDWDQDGDLNDQTFNDYAHFELMEE